MKMLVLALELKLRDFAKELTLLSSLPLPYQQFLQKLALSAMLLSLTGCSFSSFTGEAKTPEIELPVITVPTAFSSPSLPEGSDNQQLLEESWAVYREQFIQEDGRVIDYEAQDRSVSEGQAYAMLRAVLMNDERTFALTLDWAEKNLQRLDAEGKRIDNLWAWKWGQKEEGKWEPIDFNFATDADIDAVTALIFAYRRWNRSEYLDLALIKLQDIWQYSTVVVGANGKVKDNGDKGLFGRGTRYLLPGPVEAFVPSSSTIHLNPSYFAPYAFRLFAQVDSNHDWLSLVKSSYQVLEKSAQTSAVGLPSDWIALDTKTGKFQPLPPESPIKSVYSFDAYRVWWRLAWDAAWFDAPEAQEYLPTATKHLQQMWDSSSFIPARIDLQGKATVKYDATSQYAMLYPALRLIKPDIAQQMLQQKILPQYNKGVWDDESAYYTQNLAWLGIMPFSVVDPQLLQP